MKQKGNPEASQGVDWFSIHPDYDHPIGAVVNKVLTRVGSPKRARIFIFEDAVRAWEVCDKKQARTIARRLTIDRKTGNYANISASRFKRSVQIKLGLINS